MKRIIDRLEKLRKESLVTGRAYIILTVIWAALGIMLDYTQSKAATFISATAIAPLVLAVIFLTRAHDYKQLKEAAEREEQAKEKEKEK